MPTHRFSKPLSPSDAIDLFPQLLEELGITEPEETCQYIMLAPELFEPGREEDLIETMGFVPWINHADAKADLADAKADLEDAKIDLEGALAGKHAQVIAAAYEEVSAAEEDVREREENLCNADIQQTMSNLLRKHSFVFAERALGEDHYKRAFGHEKEYLVYVAQQGHAPDIKRHIAFMAGIPSEIITHKHAFEYPHPEIQYANLVTLNSIAEGIIRKIRPDGTPYRDAGPPDTEPEILTRTLLAVEEVWCRNGGDANILVAFRSAQTISALTSMNRKGYLDCEFGFFDAGMLESVRQKIAYALLKGHRHIGAIGAIGDDVLSVKDMTPEAKIASTRPLIRTAAQLLNNLVDEQFDGDVNKHTEAIGVFARFVEGDASDADRAMMAQPRFKERMEAHLTLTLLTHLLDGYDSVCNQLSNEQDKRTPRIMHRAFNHLDRYFEAAYDEMQPKLPDDAQPLMGPRLHLARQYGPPRPADRSAERLRRFKPSPDAKPH